MFSLVILAGGCSSLFSIFINEVITVDYGYSTAFYVYGVFTCIAAVLIFLLREKYNWMDYLGTSIKELLSEIDVPIAETKAEDEDQEDES